MTELAIALGTIYFIFTFKKPRAFFNDRIVEPALFHLVCKRAGHNFKTHLDWCSRCSEVKQGYLTHEIIQILADREPQECSVAELLGALRKRGLHFSRLDLINALYFLGLNIGRKRRHLGYKFEIKVRIKRL